MQLNIAEKSNENSRKYMGITIEVYVYMWINIFVCSCVENVEHFERPKFWTAACLRLLKVYINMYLYRYRKSIYVCMYSFVVYVFQFVLSLLLAQNERV